MIYITANSKCSLFNQKIGLTYNIYISRPNSIRIQQQEISHHFCDFLEEISVFEFLDKFEITDIVTYTNDNLWINNEVRMRYRNNKIDRILE